jgi:hypothetical protein
MKKMISVLAVLAVAMPAATSAAMAASITNKDGQPHLIKITENGQRSEIGIDAGEKLTICQGGCFLTMPNGDKEALSGGETIEIVGGKAVIK